MAEGFAQMIEPLGRSADFNGRSTRSDWLMFYLLIMIANMLAQAADTALFGRSPWFSMLVGAALFLPFVALNVRRLHDTGRSGWWLLLAFPALAIGLWDAWRRLGDPFARSVQSSLPTLVMTPPVLALLVLIVMLFWADEERTNRYGPNPRYGESEEAAT